jgi:hypothetical protein
MFKRLLAATEMVDFCDAPVTAALKIAKQNNAQLSILHVLESETTKDRRFVFCETFSNRKRNRCQY